MDSKVVFKKVNSITTILLSVEILFQRLVYHCKLHQKGGVLFLSLGVSPALLCGE